jgi:ABC-2 type transport system ATP-binding protein
MDPALEIHGLSKDYGDFRLKDVTFTVPRGYVCGLIGPNGAGKTTIIRLVLNLIRRDGGEVRAFGLDNIRDEVAVKSRIGFVHDTPRFYEHLSLRRIRDTVAPFYPKWDDALFNRLLREFDLPPGKRFSRLSRGTKTKFALALALSHDADLLILDEPTSGLDPVFRRRLLEKLRGVIQDEGKSVLFSTHITSDLERIADYITFIRDGGIVFSSSRDEVLDKWGVVKGGPELDEPATRDLFRGVRKGEFGVQALTDDIPGARRRLGPDAVIERASLEDIMFYLTKGNGCA